MLVYQLSPAPPPPELPPPKLPLEGDSGEPLLPPELPPQLPPRPLEIDFEGEDSLQLLPGIV